MSTRPHCLDAEILHAAAVQMAPKFPQDTCGDQIADDLEAALNDCAPDFDGYRLAKFLDAQCNWLCDSGIVSMLDDASTAVRSLVRAAVVQWVSENAIVPKCALGEVVTVKNQKGVSLYTGEVVGIDPAQATYTVFVASRGHVRQGNGTHGYIVEFECVHDLATAPKDFCLTP